MSDAPAPRRVSRRDARRKALAVALGALTLTAAPMMARAIEEPPYRVVQSFDGFEVREYPPYLVAQVVVPGPADQAGNQGFRILAGYIFGKNMGERKIAMTAPVTQAPAPQQIAMTAPVTQAPAEGGFVVQFVMPAGFTLDTLPEPLDPRVELREVPAARYAVIRYSGTWSEANYDKHLAQLRQATEAAGLRVIGSPVYSRYNGPMTPWFMRRNEIWLPLG
ncbi:MAG: heme-binding protein [Burkholderiaceae bacterium]|jgi:hypothetical protein|nr:heme-binding protein [Burkholderiaceae bacterium]